MEATIIDTLSPFVLDTRDLPRRAGSARGCKRAVTVCEELGNGVIGVPTGAPLELDLKLESVSDGVLVTGTVVTRAQGECARCLDPLTLDIDAALCELFAYESDGDELVVRDEYVDITTSVIDAVASALPFTPLCRADCEGLCVQCGQRRDHDHGGEVRDPRWAELAAFFNETKES